MADKKKPTKKGSANTTGAAKKSAARTVKASRRKSGAMKVSSPPPKKAEEKLIHSHNLMQYIISHAQSAIAVHDRDMKYIYVSEQYLREYKVKERDVIGKHHYDVFPDLPQKWRDVHQRVLAGAVESNEEDPYVREDGSVDWTRWECRPWYESGGSIGGLIVYTEVITERKRAEEALRASQKLLETIIDTSPICIKLITADGSLQRMNLAGLEMIEAESLDQVQGKCVYPLVSEEHCKAFKAMTQEVFKGKAQTLEFKMIGLKGHPLLLYTHAVPIRNEKGEVVLALATTINITERKKIEGAQMFLVECGAKGDDFFESLARYLAGSLDMDYICIDRLEGDLLTAKTVAVYFDGKFQDNVSYTLHDTPRGEVVGRDVCCFPDGVRHRFPKDAVLQDMKAESYLGVTLWSHAHQPIGLIAVIGRRPLEDPRLAESILKLVAIRAAAELERKRTEEKIRESEQFIRNILDTVDEGFLVIDRDYRLLTANKAYCDQTSLPCDEVIGKHCYEVSHKRNQPCFAEGEDCASQQVFASGDPRTAVHKHTDHDGHVIYVETKAFPIKDNSGRVTSVIETINNITEKHLLEEERLKTQKLESIGTLAGGIAHDFNNLLQGIFGYISMAKMTLDQREKSLAMLEQAEKALHQSVNLTTQLLTFSKGGKPVKKSLSLLPVIENAARFALSGSRSEYRISSAPDLWRVEADEGQLVQVVQNIVLNADQAMPLGGNVEIAAQNVSASDASLPRSIAGKDHVLITIRDSGVGMPEQYLGKIFDPYFTTKEKGSGLGLATSYSIIRNHGGLIDVRSQVGQGTAFFLYLPASEAVAEESPAAAAPGKARIGRILVMDDEKVVREVTGELLRSLGHEAEFAESGESALTMYREAMASARPFDVVILDLTIRGGMGGLETLGKLLEIDPGVKAVVSSGYSDDAALSNYREHGFKAFLKKPYNMDELQNTLNDLLG